MDDNVTIDALTSQLREVCPSLYSADDAAYSKVTYIGCYYVWYVPSLAIDQSTNSIYSFQRWQW